jgi:large subunit ribosomal protein L2
MLKIFKYFFKKFAKSFTFGIVIVAGRNFLGRICIQHKGGGQKVKYLKIDRYRNLNQFGVVLKIIKNYFYTGFVGFILYENGLCSFILLAEGLLKGSKIFSGIKKILEEGYKLGSSQRLLHINLFDTINSIELFPFSGALLARAAGTGAKIISKDNLKSVLKLSSG